MVIDLLISNWFTDQDLLVKDDINTWTTNKGPMIVECWVIFLSQTYSTSEMFSTHLFNGK